MKKTIYVVVISLILGSSYIFSGCSQKIQQENLLAEFSGQVVTLDEFEKEFAELSDREKRKYEGQDGLAEYLTLMAESRMLLEAAADKGLNRNEEIVKQANEFKDQLMVKELVKREVDEKVKVTDADLKQYYEEHKPDYVEPEKIIITEVTLKDEEKAKELMEKIKGGADFTELAKETDAKGESFGPGQGNEGKTKAFSKDAFRNAQNFANTAFGLEVNQMSDVIVQELGESTYYMIVRLDERIAPRQKEFSEVESKIRRIVQKDKKKEQMDKWLTTLKVNKKFQIYPDRMPKPAETEEVEEEKTEEVEVEPVTPSEAVEEKK